MTKTILILIAVFTFGCGAGGHPTDEKMRDWFGKDRANFVRLTTMLQEDKEIVRLTSDDVLYSQATTEPISSERREEYNKLLTSLGIHSGIHRDSPNAIRFIASSKGVLSPSSEKSFLFSTESPQPIVTSLDNMEGRADQPPTFVSLENNWYIVFETW